jgi:hypothetical protein
MLLTLVMILGATVAFAQPGRIAVYGDPAATNCAVVTPPTPGLLNIYVFHIMTSAATGCEYSAPKPACMTGASWLSDTNAFPVTIGTSQAGVSIGYGTCRQAPILVQTLVFFSSAPSGPCCIYPVLPHPLVDPPAISMVDCADNLLHPTGQSAVVNEQEGCFCIDIVPVQDTSWGQIKALYNE